MDTEFLDSNLNNEELIISHEIRGFLKETAKWAKLLSIVGFVIIALMVIFGLFMGTFMASMLGSVPDSPGLNPMIGGTAMTIFYLIVAVLYVMPVLYLYRYSTNMKKALENNNQQFLSDSFRNLKSHYKFIGILMLVLIILYVGGILLAFIGGIMAS